MDHLINKIVSGIKDSLINHGFDWIITVVITYITVHLATKKYYNSVRKSTVRPCMEQGLKLILEKDIIPANAKSILVENKGIAIFRWKKYKCRHPFSLLRKTVCTVGGNENSTSEARPRFWAVLGLAYQLKSIVVYDFKQHRLLVYSVDIEEYISIEKENGDDTEYYFRGKINGSAKECYLSDKRSGRNIMIAIPLISDNRIVGGVTFDVDCEISTDPQNTKKYLIGSNRKEVIELCKKLNDIGSNIVNAYFVGR